jgi:hypothetical protein
MFDKGQRPKNTNLFKKIFIFAVFPPASPNLFFFSRPELFSGQAARPLSTDQQKI